jgi:cytochrome c
MPTKLVLAAALIGLAIPLAAPASAADAENGEKVFKQQCGACHSPVAGKNGVGPSLFGIVGRTAGSVDGFRYSAANKGSGIAWTAEKLDPYIKNPKEIVPGTTMPYIGLKDDAKRADLIAYLETVK